MWNPFKATSESNLRRTEIDRSLSEAFSKIKAERSLVFSWLNYLRKKDLANENSMQQASFRLGEHESELKNVQEQLKIMREDLKELLRRERDSIEREKDLLRREKISPFADQNQLVRTKSGPESGPVSEPISEGGFVKRVIAMIRPQKKDYVLKKILEYVEAEPHTTKQLERVIVREKQLCGRTAFYDYLKELRLKGEIKTAQKNGRKVLAIAEN